MSLKVFIELHLHLKPKVRMLFTHLWLVGFTVHALIAHAPRLLGVHMITPACSANPTVLVGESIPVL